MRIHNTNTQEAHRGPRPVEGRRGGGRGRLRAGRRGRAGARIALDFLDPGGAGTGRLLPTGHRATWIDGVEASLVDATNPMVFVRAKDLGLIGTETPRTIDADRALTARLEAIRVEAAARMGIPGSAAAPKIAMVAAPAGFTAPRRRRLRGRTASTSWRASSPWAPATAPSRSPPPCAWRWPPGSRARVVHEAPARGPATSAWAIPPACFRSTPRSCRARAATWAEQVTVYRTARRLMEGFVRVP